MKSLLLSLWVLLVASLVWGRVDYADRNINWGAVAVSDVEREEVKSAGLSSRSVTPTIYESRTLTLATGSQIRIRERIEQNATGGEDRIFINGHQLSEISVVADPADADAVALRLEDLGCTNIRRYGHSGRIMIARVPQVTDVATQVVLDELSVMGVVSAEHAQVKFFTTSAIPSATPNDPLYSNQWALVKVGVTNVWARGYLGFPNIPCAVFDTGVHLTHEDLQINVQRRISALHSSADPEDHHGHGSHCLGIMGADGNNGKGITGVGQVANLTSIRGPISYWEEGDTILDGFQWALDNGIKILSCSFGSPVGEIYYDATEYAIINDLGRAGTLVVIAAGNDGNNNDRLPTYPASYDCDNIISVVCSNPLDKPSNLIENGWASSYGALSCDIAAPGTDILSCIRDADNAYDSWSGTSMATPLVAACAAMVWERNPSWTYRDVRDRLYATACATPELAGYCRTGARIDLDRALDENTGFITVDTLPKTYNDGEMISLTVKTSADISQVSVTLKNRDDPEFSVEMGTFDVTPGTTTSIPVWTPTAADKRRGYMFRVASTTDAAAFSYSSVFRVKYGSVQETIEVIAPAAGAQLDADELGITFVASDAVLVDLAIESLSTNGVWELDATLGDATAIPGANKTVSAHLIGRGWIRDRPYRILVRDADDEAVYDYSEEFRITKSTGSVYLVPGDPTSTLGVGTETWQTSYNADAEIRVTCWMPDTSLYWLYLVPETENAAEGMILLKQTWVDDRTGLENGRREYRTFSVAIPDEFANGTLYYLRFMDAFDYEMYDASPLFSIEPRADGRKTPSFTEAMGDPSDREYVSQCLWYPEVQSETIDGSTTNTTWALRSAWVGRDELAFFDTTVDGPCQLQCDMRVSSKDDHGVMTISYTKPPVLESSAEWTPLYTQSGKRDWAPVTCDIPTGTWTIRFMYKRDSDPEAAGQNATWIKNLKFAPTAEDVKISLNGNRLTMSGGMAWPGYIAYTLDGTAPTVNSTQWVPTQTLTLYQSTRIRARAYRAGYEPGQESTAFYSALAGDGTATNAYVIATVTDWEVVVRNVNSGYDYAGKRLILAQDIDCTGVTFTAAGYSSEMLQPGAEPRSFKGTLDGQGFSLLNPTFSGAGTDDTRLSVGLFGYIGSGGAVSNLVVRNPSFSLSIRDLSMSNFGGTIAARNDGTIRHCIVLDANLHLTATLGGIAGVSSGAIRDCFFSGRLSTQKTSFDDLCLGGIVGSVATDNDWDVGEVAGSVACADLILTSTSGGAGYVGGVAGYAYEATFRDVGATATLTKSGSGRIYTGKILGYREGNTSTNMYGVLIVDPETRATDVRENEKFDATLWTTNATINYGYPIPLWLSMPEPLIASPVVTPTSRPYADPITVTATPAEPTHAIYYTTNGLLPTVESTLYTGPIELQPDGGVYNFIFCSVAPNGVISAPVRVTYNSYNKLVCQGIVFSGMTNDGNLGSPLLPGTTIEIPPLEIKCHLACPTAGAWMTYTLDGAEPLETSTRYVAPFDLPGSCTIKARAFYPPGYAASGIGTREIRIIKDNLYRADLTLVNATKKSGAYWSENFRIQANAAPKGKRFSHWLVTGPLVLEESQRTSSDMTFRWMTKEALTLEAIYEALPGFRFNLK